MLTLLALAPLVNVIPVVARAECLSSGERLLRSYLVQESLQNLKAPLFTPSVSPSVTISSKFFIINTSKY